MEVPLHRRRLESLGQPARQMGDRRTGELILSQGDAHPELRLTSDGKLTLNRQANRLVRHLAATHLSMWPSQQAYIGLHAANFHNVAPHLQYACSSPVLQGKLKDGFAA